MIQWILALFNRFPKNPVDGTVYLKGRNVYFYSRGKWKHVDTIQVD
jgi:hypothetical protein